MALHTYSSEDAVGIRNEVNDWIRTGSAFDGIADVDTAMRDSEDSSLIKGGVAPNDHIVRGLRCTNIGYREIAAPIAQALLAVGYD